MHPRPARPAPSTLRWAQCAGLVFCFLFGTAACGDEDTEPAPGGADAGDAPSHPSCRSMEASDYGVRRDPVSGRPLHRDLDACVAWAVAAVDSREQPLQRLRPAVGRGLAQWQAADCLSLCLQEGDPAEPDSLGFDPDAESSETLILWVASEADWRSRHSQLAIAVTTIVSQPSTGLILDADIELNDFGDYRWSVEETDVDADVQSVVAHEFGHGLGLAHAGDPTAVMWGEWEPGWLARQLSDVDIAGLCTLYLCPELLGDL